MSQNPIIKKGYKQTEIGMIPEDWEVQSLQKLVDQNRKIRYGIVQPGNFDSNGRYMIRGQDYSFGWNKPETLFKVSPQIEQRYKNARVKNGDIILTIVGAGTGKLERIPDWLDGANITQTTARIAIDNKKANGLFCMYSLQSLKGQEEISNYIKGNAQPGLNIRDVEIFRIALPANTIEQSAIASILSDTDALIESLDKLIEKKKAIKQGTMQELLTGKRRLPGFSGEWKTCKLGEIAGFYKGKGLPKSSILESGKYKCIHYGELFTHYGEEIKKIKGFTNDSENLFYSRSNDVLMPTSDVTPNGLAKASAVMEDGVILGGDVMVIRTFEGKVNGTFLSYSIRFDKDKIMQLVSGSTVYHLYGSDMKKYEFKLPPSKDEQDAIVKILNEMNEEIEKLENKRNKLHSTKQGMMQQLLTGNIRVYGK